MKKGKHFFNVIEHDRDFEANLLDLRFQGSGKKDKAVQVLTMTALRHDDERIFVETTVRNYKFRCKNTLDLAEWLYAFLCALHIQADVKRYCDGTALRWIRWVSTDGML